MQKSAFRTEEEQHRYRDFFDQGRRHWKLNPDEHAAAEAVFRQSPTLRPFRTILNGAVPGLDMHAVDKAGEQGTTVRVVLAAALAVITVPNIAWAYLGDPTLSSVVDHLTVEDLEALASAKRIRT